MYFRLTIGCTYVPTPHSKLEWYRKVDEGKVICTISCTYVLYLLLTIGCTYVPTPHSKLEWYRKVDVGNVIFTISCTYVPTPHYRLYQCTYTSF